MKLLRMLVVIWLGALAVWNAPGAAGVPPAAPAPAKYLFLVETTARLAPQSEKLALAVADLIERGLGGRMQDGDLFTVIPYHEKVNTPGLASQTWEAARSRPVSNQAFLFLQKLKFEKSARIDRVMSLLQQVVLVDKDLTVYLVCSGEDLVADTPFDKEINAALQQHVKAWRTRRAVCVIALVAERGKWVDWAVGAADPPAPARLVVRREAPPLVKPATNQAAFTGATNVLKPPSVVAPSPKTNEVAVVVLPKPPKETPPAGGVTNAVAGVTPPPPSTNQAATVATNETAVVKPSAPPAANPIVEVKPAPPPPPPVAPPSPSTNPVVLVEPPKPAPVEVKLPPVEVKPVPVEPQPAPAPPPPVVATVTQVVVVVSNPPPDTSGATSQVVEPTLAPTNPPVPSAVIAIIPEPAPRPYGLMAAGAGLLALAVWLAVVWQRRARPATGPSLITQSMNRDRAKKGQ